MTSQYKNLTMEKTSGCCMNINSSGGWHFQILTRCIDLVLIPFSFNGVSGQIIVCLEGIQMFLSHWILSELVSSTYIHMYIQIQKVCMHLIVKILLRYMYIDIILYLYGYVIATHVPILRLYNGVKASSIYWRFVRVDLKISTLVARTIE